MPQQLQETRRINSHSDSFIRTQKIQQHGRPHPPRPFREQAQAILQHCCRAGSVRPRLQTPRGHRHTEPDPATAHESVGPGGAHCAAVQGDFAGPVAGKVLDWCGRAAERYGLEAVEYGWSCSEGYDAEAEEGECQCQCQGECKTNSKRGGRIISAPAFCFVGGCGRQDRHLSDGLSGLSGLSDDWL